MVSPALHEPNPAAYLAWVVGGAIMALFVLVLIFDAVGWLLTRPWKREKDEAPSRSGLQWQLREPDSTLRGRHFHRVFGRWYWQRSEKPDRSNIGIETKAPKPPDPAVAAEDTSRAGGPKKGPDQQ